MRNFFSFCLGCFTWRIESPPLHGRRYGRHAAHSKVIRAARVIPCRLIIDYRLAAGLKPSALQLLALQRYRTTAGTILAHPLPRAPRVFRQLTALLAEAILPTSANRPLTGYGRSGRYS